jgi:hypothetical protein
MASKLLGRQRWMLWLWALAWAGAAYFYPAASAPASEHPLWAGLAYTFFALVGLCCLAAYGVCRVVVAIGREIRGAGRERQVPAGAEPHAPRPPPSGPGWWRE